MKRGGPTHPKMFELASQLNIPIYSAVGLMEMLWHFADDYAIQGDIGKHSDQVIAKAVGWAEDPSQLISALVSSRFLDKCPVHRLLVHDWEDHCTDYLKKKLKRYGLTIYRVSGQTPELSGLFSLPMAGIGVVGQGEKGVQTKHGQNPDSELLAEICAGYDRHLKHSNREPRDLVVQQVISMNGKFSVDRFRGNHPGYCSFYDEHGWSYSTLTFLGWINAGMPPPPPTKSSRQSQPSDTRYVD